MFFVWEQLQWPLDNPFLLAPQKLLAYVIGWSVLYTTLRGCAPKAWADNALGFCHAVWQLWRLRNAAEPHLVQDVFVASASYFLLEAFWVARRSTETFHGLVCALGYCTVILAKNKLLDGLGVKFLFYEASTPFMHARYLLKGIGAPHLLVFFSEVLFALVFFFVRGVLGFQWTYEAYVALLTRGHGLGVVVTVLLCTALFASVCLNVYWMNLIVRLGLKYVPFRSKKQT